MATATSTPVWKTGTIIYGDEPGKVFYWKQNPSGGAIFIWTDEEPEPVERWYTEAEMVCDVNVRGGVIAETPVGVVQTLAHLTTINAPSTVPALAPNPGGKQLSLLARIKLGVERDEAALQARGLLNALRFYVSICGNPAAQVSRESAQEMHAQAIIALADAEGR